MAGKDGQVTPEIVWCVAGEWLGPRILAPLSRAVKVLGAAGAAGCWLKERGKDKRDWAEMFWETSLTPRSLCLVSSSFLPAWCPRQHPVPKRLHPALVVEPSSVNLHLRCSSQG